MPVLGTYTNAADHTACKTAEVTGLPLTAMDNGLSGVDGLGNDRADT